MWISGSGRRVIPEAAKAPIVPRSQHPAPAPSVSVYEERMHGWVVPPADAEHIL